MNKNVKKPKRKTSKKKSRNSIGLFQRTLKFLPAIIILAASFSLNSLPALGASVKKSPKDVLSYATSMGSGDLLARTNTERSQNGVGSLTLNNQLNSAAQSKANDMVARNYWSHNTPTGEEPWVFFQNAGYSYKTAGENLAYGFDTSSDTVTGWMNSPPHRDNLLNSAFQEVGFGFANSSDYVSSGEQTIVVAMYGTPLVQSANTAAKPASPQPVAQAQAPAPINQTVPAPEPTQPTPPIEPKDTEPLATGSTEKETTPEAPTASIPVASAVQVSRIQILTGGNARWSSTLLVLSLCAVVMLWLIQRGAEVKRLLRSGEHFLLHNIHLDLTVVAFLVLGFTLVQTSGTIR